MVMKKIIFILLLCRPLFAEPFFFNLHLKNTGTFCFSPEEKSTYSGALGTYLNFNCVSLRGFTTIPQTPLTDFPALFSSRDFASIFTKNRWGADIQLFKKTLNVRAGSLSFSRSISRLKNPVPYLSSSPVVKSFTSTSGIGTSLPSLSSTKKPFAVYSALNLFSIKLPFAFQTAFCPEDEAFSVSANTKIIFSKRIYLKTYATFSSNILENNSSYIKRQNAAFQKGRFSAFSLENSFTSPALKINFNAGLHQNPGSKNILWLNSKLRFTAGQFRLDAGAYAIPQTPGKVTAVPLISTDSSIIKTVEQTFINPQVIFLFKNNATLTLGIAASQTQKIAGTTKIALLNVARITAGLLFEQKDFTLKSNFTAGNFLLEGTPPTKSTTPDTFYEGSLSANKNAKNFRANFSSKYRHYPPSDKTDDTRQEFSADAGASFGKSRCIKLTAGWDSTIKNGEKTASEYSLGAAWSFKKKYFSSTVKVTFSQKSN